MRDDLGDQAQASPGSTLPSSRRSSSSRLRSAAAAAVGQRAAQLGLGGDDAPEPEELVLEVVEPALGLGLGGLGDHREPLERVGQVARTRPAQPDDVPRPGRAPPRRQLALEQDPGRAGLAARRLLRRVGQRAAQPVLAVEQVHHREQLVAERAEVGTGRHDRVEPLLGRRPATPCSHTAHQAPPCDAARSRAPRGTGRRCGAAWPRPRGTRRRCGRPGRRTAGRRQPQLVQACWRSASICGVPARRCAGPRPGPARASRP